MLAMLLVGCGAATEPAPVVAAAPVVPAPVVAAAPVVVAATGAGECDSLPIRCARAIASRQEEGRTIVYLSEETKGGVRPGQWVHCVHEDRGPSPPCEVLAIVDGGQLEASCGEAAPSCGDEPSRASSRAAARALAPAPTEAPDGAPRAAAARKEIGEVDAPP